MEERRKEGGRLLKAGKLSQAEIARHLGVSRATVSDWAKVVESQGLKGLKSKKAKGVEAKLSQAQKQRLKQILTQGALRHGFSTERWTLARIRQVIQEKFKVSYHAKYLSRFLKQLGFSPQKPMPQAIEQEKELVRAWLENDWARIKKVATARRRSHSLG
jgi:putative transposase